MREPSDASQDPSADAPGMARHPLAAGSVASGVGHRRLLVGSVTLAVLVAAALVVVFTRGSNGSVPAPTAVTGAQGVESLLHGIPQQGTALGSPEAPVTLVEFADLQCPYCAVWARRALPTIVDRYVRPGKVQLVFEGMAFVGPDSVTALRTALAAGRQNRFWNVLDLLYANQGTENTGWVTDSLVRSIGAAVPGLDTERMLGDRGSVAVDRMIAEADSVARSAGVNSTPTFAVGSTGERLRIVRATSLDASALTREIDAALNR
jgi:protein-disulfide isomerase